MVLFTNCEIVGYVCANSQQFSTDTNRTCLELRSSLITCSTVMLQCYRRQAIPMKQGKIRSSVTLYSLDLSLQNLVWMIMSATPTHMPVLVQFD